MDIERFSWHDVWGLDPELLCMIPSPCVAVCLLYPSKNISGPRRAEYAARDDIDKEMGLGEDDGSAFFLLQHPQFGNACGTIGMVHALINNHLHNPSFTLRKGPLVDFLEANRARTPSERGSALAQARSIHEVSEESARGGADGSLAQTACPDRNDRVDAHFIVFCEVAGTLVEFDGCQSFPVPHGPTTRATLLQDAAKIIMEDFMARDPGNVNFNVMALCGEGSDNIEGENRAAAAVESQARNVALQSEKVERLMELGFPKEHVEQVLAGCAGDEARAANMLLG
jgi:ubiquitin carboxyl-terminal hydrolase L3